MLRVTGLGFRVTGLGLKVTGFRDNNILYIEREKHREGNNIKIVGKKSSKAKDKKMDAPKTNKNTGVQRNITKPSGKRRVPLIVAAVVLAALCVSVTAAGFAVTLSGKIYPNVSVGGVRVGGMTTEQAIRLLDAEGFGALPGGVLTVRFPLGYALELDVSEATLTGQIPALANMAYSHGRRGNIVSNLLAYLSALSGGVDILDGEFISVNEDYVKSLIDEIARSIAADELNQAMTIGSSELTLIKGSNHIVIDVEKVYAMVWAALAERNYSAIEYLPSLSGDDSVDFVSLYALVYREPENAAYDAATGGVTEHISGRSFDVNEARILWDQARTGDYVKIPLAIKEPEITAEFLRRSLFADVLAQKSTTLYGSSSSRINNINLAAQSLNGIILNPGDEFSYNEALGQRTAAAGYQYAGAYSGGKVVSEIGGGICQGSSTLYYVALYSNLEILDRTCHYFAIGYLPSGLDATVSWPAPDFRFRNNREYPIKIEAYTDMTDYTLTIRIYGTDTDGSYVKIETETWGTATGTGALSYRLVFDKNDKLVSRLEEARSIYHYPVEEEEEEEETAEETEEEETGEEEETNEETGEEEAVEEEENGGEENDWPWDPGDPDGPPIDDEPAADPEPPPEAEPPAEAQENSPPVRPPEANI